MSCGLVVRVTGTAVGVVVIAVVGTAIVLAEEVVAAVPVVTVAGAALLEVVYTEPPKRKNRLVLRTTGCELVACSVPDRKSVV